MKYNKFLDNRARYVGFVLNSKDTHFNLNAHIEFPPVNYMFELSEEDLQKFSREFSRRSSEIFNELVEKYTKETK